MRRERSAPTSGGVDQQDRATHAEGALPWGGFHVGRSPKTASAGAERHTGPARGWLRCFEASGAGDGAALGHSGAGGLAAPGYPPGVAASRRSGAGGLAAPGYPPGVAALGHSGAGGLAAAGHPPGVAAPGHRCGRPRRLAASTAGRLAASQRPLRAASPPRSTGLRLSSGQSASSTPNPAGRTGGALWSSRIPRVGAHTSARRGGFVLQLAVWARPNAQAPTPRPALRPPPRPLWRLQLDGTDRALAGGGARRLRAPRRRSAKPPNPQPPAPDPGPRLSLTRPASHAPASRGRCWRSRPR